MDLKEAPQSYRDDELLVLEKVSHVVDLSRWPEAIDTLRQLNRLSHEPPDRGTTDG